MEVAWNRRRVVKCFEQAKCELAKNTPSEAHWKEYLQNKCAL